MNDQPLEILIDDMTDRERLIFACDCAEHVLGFFKVEFPDDDRPYLVVQVARKYADGTTDFAELERKSEIAKQSADIAGQQNLINAHQAAFAAVLLGLFPSTREVASTVATAASAAAGGTHAVKSDTNMKRKREEEWQRQRAIEILKSRG